MEWLRRFGREGEPGRDADQANGYDSTGPVMEREAILDEEISQPVEKAPLDEALRRWNVSGELLKDMLLRYFSNLNFRYEQEARNGDHPKENDPLQYLNPYGEYCIEVYVGGSAAG